MRDIVIAQDGTLFGSTFGGNQILSMSPDFVTTLFAGKTAGGFDNGNRLNATFRAPKGNLV
jgi:hypothetical protein